MNLRISPIRSLISSSGRFQFSAENRLDPTLVAHRARQVVPLGPAAVAVHDDRHVARAMRASVTDIGSRASRALHHDMTLAENAAVTGS
jgi:hypothetical protein